MPRPTHGAFEEDRASPQPSPARKADRARRRPADEDEDDDALSTLIPYKNGKALAAYYCGVFALIPCVGLVLGTLAVIFGILGYRFARAHPKAHGTGHAITGIILGSIVLLVHLAIIGLILVGAIASARVGARWG